MRILFFILGLTLFVVLAQRITIEDLWGVWASLDWRYSFLAFASYLGVNVMRAERLALILRRKISRRALLPIIFLQNFFNVLFPFSGDVAYVSVLRKKKAITIGENVASLLSAKIFDLVMLLAIFFLAILFIGSPELWLLRLPLVVLLAASVSIAGFLMFRPALLLAPLRRMREKREPARTGLNFLLAKLEETAHGFSVLREKKVGVRVGIATLANWIFTFLSGFLLLKGMGVPISFGETLFAYTFPIAAGLTPAFVFGGFGSYEGSLALGLTLVGVGAAPAISASIALHIQELIFLAALAGVGLVLYSFGPEYYGDNK